MNGTILGDLIRLFMLAGGLSKQRIGDWRNLGHFSVFHKN